MEKKIEKSRTTFVCLVLFIAVAGAIFGWQHLLQGRDAAEVDAIDSIRRSAGIVTLDPHRHAQVVDLRLTSGAEQVASAIMHLPQLPYLTSLQLGGTDVSGVQWEEIAHCTSLTTLDVSETALGDAELLSILRLRRLRSLNLAGTNISSAGLQDISRLRSLEILDLSETDIDEGFGSLSALNDLQHLLLRGIALSDDDLESLESLPKLSRLTLIDSVVSEAAIESMRDSRPGIKIDGK